MVIFKFFDWLKGSKVRLGNFYFFIFLLGFTGLFLSRFTSDFFGWFWFVVGVYLFYNAVYGMGRMKIEPSDD